MDTPAPRIRRIADHVDHLDEDQIAVREGLVERNGPRIREILGALFRHGTCAELRKAEQQVQLKPLIFSEALDIMQWELIDTRVRVGSGTVTLLGYNALYRFEVHQVLQHGNKLTIPTPSQIYMIRERWQRRQPVDDLKLLFQLPNGRMVERTLRDISYCGLAIYHNDDNGEILLDGESIEGALVLSGDVEIKIQATVVQVSTSDQGDICHLQIPSLPRRKNGWVELVNDRLHPGTKTGSTHRSDTWKLYTDSGDLQLPFSSADDLHMLQRAYEAVVLQLDRAPELGCQVVWPNLGGGVSAAISMLKVYCHTWVGFQMVRASGECESGTSKLKILREIHLRAYEHAQQDPDLRWVVAYARLSEDWNRVLHHDLPERYVRRGEACIVRIRALQFEVGDFYLSAHSDVEVDRPSAAELHALAINIGRSRSEAYCDALDLVPERMAMSRIRKLFVRTSLGRDRSVLVVRHCGRAVAAAVAEMGSDGLHVLGLLDLVRLYPLTSKGASHYPELLAGCAKWFKERAKKTFCVYLEREQVLPSKVMKTATDLGPVDMVILSAKRLPEFYEHIHTVTSPQTHQLEVSQSDPQ